MKMHKKGRFSRKEWLARPAAAGDVSPSPTAIVSPRGKTAAALRASERLAFASEEAARLEKSAADLRKEIATLRNAVSHAQEEVLRAKAEAKVQTEAQLRDVNERLVIATVNAQLMAEAAERTSTHMSYMAEHDFLTGLPNRALLTDRLAQAIALAERHQKKVALMYLDLDHFKHINDSLGHAVGDQLLQSAAARLEACVRHSDTVCRQGGDEFVVLLVDLDDQQDAAVTAEKLLAAMAKPHVIGEHRLHVTLSIGISLFPDDGRDVEAIVRNADTAMYQAKRSGRNNFQRFTREMNARAVARQSIEVALHLALEQHEFSLYYQPRINLETGDVTGAEALLRWQCPGAHLLEPSVFLGIAQDCGLILPIGNWVLREACRQAQAWRQASLNFGHIAVNVSSIEFHSKGFLAGVRAALDDSGLAPCYLELEITETGLMHDTQTTLAVLHGLKALGVQIAVDDFGAGYSSLSYLKHCPVDTLKIDQSFVSDIGDRGGDAIVGAVIAMGTNLGQRVVAKGVETQQQLIFLQTHHCAEAQGFLFSQPATAQEFATLLCRAWDEHRH